MTGKFNTLAPLRTKFTNMTPPRRTRIKNIVSRAVANTDFRFAGDPNEVYHLTTINLTAYAKRVEVEILFKYRTESELVRPGDRDSRDEYDITTTIERMAEFSIYTPDECPVDDTLISEIESDIPDAVFDSFEKFGTTLKFGI